MVPVMSVGISASEIAVHRALFVLRWVTVFSGVYHLGIFIKPPRSSQLPTLGRVGNKYQEKGDDALQLESNGRMLHYTCG